MVYIVPRRDRSSLYYQPQVKLFTGQITGLEASLSWNHPQIGMIPPSIFSFS
ncbi:EAL domain-containing protein [Ruminiclostridium cellobioparum]|uniref:EAL domain-containing protein n=1 Tax=Ruminiclostridium cellobioparum TaxID=29355 RepID=UPI003BF995E7